MTQKIPRIITKRQLRLIVPYSVQHLLRLERKGKFPKRIQIGARRVGWYLSDVESWLQQRVRGIPAAPRAAASGYKRGKSCASSDSEQ